MFKNLLFIIFFVLLISNTCLANPSVDVPVRHWSYDAIEKLAIVGLCDISSIGSRPVSRVRMAYIIKDVIDRSASYEEELNWSEQEYLETLIYNLIDEFREELVTIGVEVASVTEVGPKKNIFNKPGLSIEKVYTSLESDRAVFENKEGWKLKDGFNLRAKLTSWAKFANFFAASLTPGVRYAAREGDTDIDIENAQIRFSHPSRNMELAIGRGSMWWGPGFHGSLLMTDNAFPLDMVRWNNVYPFRLPGWPLKKIGRFNAQFFTARLEKSRVIEHTFVTGWRLDYTPCGFLKFGFGHILMHGGKGVDKASLADYLSAASLVFSAAGGGEEAENHIISGDIQLFIKRIDKFLPIATGAKLYTEWGGEDESRNVPINLATVTGIYLTDLLKIAGFDGKIEYAKFDKIWYTHFKYASGYTHHGNIIGHSLGGDSEEIAATSIFNFPGEYKLNATFSRQKRGLTKALIETTNELRIEFNMQDALNMYNIQNIELSFFYEFEDITNYDNTSTKARNHIFGLEATRRF
ncbi:MAG: capsule assembly Wzi family protein [Candidatus Omnitrophota bacterium]